MKKYSGLILLTILIFVKIAWAQQNITFKLKPTSSIQSVHVVGDFNDWSKTANPLYDKDGDGIWETTISLEPGEYQYRFLINNRIWIKDPENPLWGGDHSNSILWIKSPQQPLLKNLMAAYGSVICSSNFTIEAQYIDGIEKHGLEIENIKILLNNRSQKFRYNKKPNKIECEITQIEDGEHLLEIRAQDRNGNRTKPVKSFFVVKSANHPPIVDAGYTIIAGVNSNVKLTSGIYYDPDKYPIQDYEWKLIAKPIGSQTELEAENMPFPNFKPDQVGRYVFTLKISDEQSWSNLDSVDVYAFEKRDYPVEFNLSDSAFAAIYKTSIDSVSVAGEFNQWSATANPLNDDDHNGIWTANINLDPGEYEYKFVVNGNLWIADPANAEKISDGWSGFNSVISGSLNSMPIVKAKATVDSGKIIFDASETYSKIGRNLSYFWIQDINNPQRFDLPATEKLSFQMPKTSGTYYFYLVVIDQFGVSSQKTIVLNIEEGVVKIRDFNDSPDWAKDAVVYEVFVRQFTPQGNFSGLINKIPYLKALGVNCLWLMPIWDGPTSHGYGPTNFFDVEKDYGTLEEFKKFVTEAHQSGIRIILDFVANHTSDQHRYFLAAYQNPLSPFRYWYRWHSEDKEKLYYPYEFHNDWDTLPNLNYENLNVRWYIIETAEFWAKLGVDGFRCDVAWGVPHDFWKLFRRSLKNINPDFLIIDEVLPRSPDYHKDEFDMSYDTDFYGNLLDVMNKHKPLAAIEYGLRKTQKNYPAYTLDFRYIENHDMDRFISMFGMDKTKLAATLLLTIPGTPLIYYGQEIGLREKTPKMNWDEQGNTLFEFYKKLIHLRRQHVCLRRGEMIKVPNNAEKDIYSYLRIFNDESFLIILNFGEKQQHCQLIFPDHFIKQNFKKGLKLENMLTSEQVRTQIIRLNQVEFDLNKEAAYIYKIFN